MPDRLGIKSTQVANPNVVMGLCLVSLVQWDMVHCYSYPCRGWGLSEPQARATQKTIFHLERRKNEKWRKRWGESIFGYEKWLIGHFYGLLAIFYDWEPIGLGHKGGGEERSSHCSLMKNEGYCVHISRIRLKIWLSQVLSDSGCSRESPHLSACSEASASKAELGKKIEKFWLSHACFVVA